MFSLLCSRNISVIYIFYHVASYTHLVGCFLLRIESYRWFYRLIHSYLPTAAPTEAPRLDAHINYIPEGQLFSGCVSTNTTFLFFLFKNCFPTSFNTWAMFWGISEHLLYARSPLRSPQGWFFTWIFRALLGFWIKMRLSVDIWRSVWLLRCGWQKISLRHPASAQTCSWLCRELSPQTKQVHFSAGCWPSGR